MAANFPGGVVVDGRNAGVAIPIRRVVRVATLIPGTLATSFESGDVVDGVILATGDRILIKNQASAVENGIYVVEAAGAPFRDVDFEDGASVAGMIIPVVDGSQAGSIWHCTNILGSDIVGADSLTFGTAGGTINGQNSSTDNAVVRWDGATGTLIKNSGVILSDSNNMTGLANVGMSGDILDAAGNELINFVTAASAVNEITITNAATGTNPIISATGDDANVSLEYLSKGTGVHIFDNDTAAAEIRLRDNTGTDYFGMRPAAATTTYTITMPAAQGAVSTYLQNNGAGILSWVVGTSGVIQSYFTSATGTTSTSNVAYTLVGSMTIATPAAGTYAVWFSTSIEKNNNNGFGNYMISIDGGVSVASTSERIYEPSAGADFHPASTQAMVTVTGVENIQVYFKVGAGGGSITMADRSIMAIKLS